MLQIDSLDREWRCGRKATLLRGIIHRPGVIPLAKVWLVNKSGMFFALAHKLMLFFFFIVKVYVYRTVVST